MNRMSTVIVLLAFAASAVYMASQPAAAWLQASPPANPSASNVDLGGIIKQQFGSTFKIPAKFPTPLITADFDGDGVEDAAIVATSAEPFPDSYAFKYKVVDPYSAYFGMGNPATSSTFSSSDPERNFDVLIIFGAGAEGWRAATPKQKFVVINLPFDDIAVGRMLIKKNKPPVFVIKARESQVMDSAIWWDAKKKRWKWEPGNPP